MSNLPLAFAEILVGGIIATAGITGDSFSNIIKGEITRHPLEGSSSSSSSPSSSGGSSPVGTVTANIKAPQIGAGSITQQRTNFAAALLRAIGAPLSKANISSIVDWQAREGGNWYNTARYNPLNTTQAEPGYSETGTQGNIGSYLSWAQGLQATVQTLENGSYSDILAALRSGGGLGGQSFEGLYTWSGHGYSSVP